MTTLTSEANGVEQPLEGENPSKSPVRGYAAGKKDYYLRLGKIEGQVRGLQKMIEDDRWCPDVVTQVSAVTRALQEVAIGLLKDHLDCCVVEAVRRSEDDGKKAIEEVVSTLRQVVRL